MTEQGAVTRRRFLRGAAGTAAVAGASGVAAAQQSPSGGPSVEVDLVDYEFDPGTNSPLTIPPGTTVKFVWKTGGHNIHVDSQPSGANWQGNESIENAGYSTSFTFTVEGTYHFWCVPHKSLGMVGDIQVKKGAPTPGGGSKATVPGIPNTAKTLGLGLFLAMATTLGLAYVLLKFGGNEDGPD